MGAKVKFVNFWDNNRGYMRFRDWFRVWGIELEEVVNPDVLFYSVFGLDHLKYNCRKVFFTWENYPHYRRIDFDGYDFAISHYKIKDPRHYWMPSWGWKLMSSPEMRKWITTPGEKGATPLNPEKQKKCCFVVSNEKCEQRNTFFHSLSERITVDSAGGYLNNLGYCAPKGFYEYLEWMNAYKFVIAFENSSAPGYSTEKILWPFLANAVPIYWGDSILDETLNPDCYINCHRYKSFDEVIEEVMRLDEDEDAYLRMLTAPRFRENKLPKEFNTTRFTKWLKQSVFHI